MHSTFWVVQCKLEELGPGGATAYGKDTVLSLDSPGFSIPNMSTSKGIKRKWSLMDGSISEQVGSPLALRLGRSSSSSDSKGSSTTARTATSSAKESDVESSMDIELDFTLHLGNEKVYNPKKPAGSDLKGQGLQLNVDLELSLSTGFSESDITGVHLSSSPDTPGTSMPIEVEGPPNADERSTSCHWKPGNGLPPFQSLPTKEASVFFKEVPRSIDLSFIVPELSSSVIATPKSSVTCTSRITRQQQPQHRSSSSKTCQVEGCGKGARGASGHCISHGGGRRCQKPGCHKGAEGVGLCIARPMVAVGDVNFLVAQKVQKVVLISVLPTVVVGVGDVAMMVVLELQEANLDYAYVMVVGRDVKWKIAQGVLKASQDFASHMEEGVDASLLVAQKEHKGAPCSARHMVVENGAHI